ncbi:MAG: hypothetical protein HY898_24575 [Deltaproteobacteria bacterium]|nr:hypothetical protein [Deltaproteobacteria bacterium]
MRSVLSLPLVALAALSACNEKMPEEKPTPPDMSALVGAYAQPSINLDQSNIAAIAQSESTIGAMVDKARALEPLIRSALEQSAKEATKPQSSDDSDPSMQTQALTGEGFMLVHRICPGWVEGAPADEANGAMDFTVGFTEKGIDPVVWGSLTACKVGIQGTGSELAGDLRIHLGDNGAAFDAIASTVLLFEFKMEMKTGDKVDALAADFRLDPSGGIEYRVFAGDPFALYFDDLKQRGYLAANGKFICDFDKKQCSNGTAPTLTW